MSPVQLPPQKKLEGPLLKRNWWISLVFLAVAVIGSGIWYGYKQVQKVKRAYRSVSIIDTDSTAVADTDDLVIVDTLKPGGYLLTEPFNRSIDAATLNITGGGVTLRLQDTATDLFSVETTKELFHLDRNAGAKSWTLHFERTSKKKANDELTSFLTYIKLNNKPVWNINLDMGGCDVDFDLSRFKLDSMKLSGGAGTFKLKLGQPFKDNHIEIRTGAAEVTLEIPSNAACQIHLNSTLSSNKFEGFKKEGDNLYQTPDFARGSKKIYIEMEGGISDFKVHKY